VISVVFPSSLPVVIEILLTVQKLISLKVLKGSIQQE
jgi:hypothetical protein